MLSPSSLQQTECTTNLSLSDTSISKNKYSALESVSSLSSWSGASGKRQCSTIPGAVALNGLKESLDKFNKTAEHGFSLPQPHIHDTSPEHHAKAMACLQEIETHLDDAHIIALIDLFKADTAEADTYMSLQRDVLCKTWLEKQLVECCGVPADDIITTV